MIESCVALMAYTVKEVLLRPARMGFLFENHHFV